MSAICSQPCHIITCANTHSALHSCALSTPQPRPKPSLYDYTASMGAQKSPPPRAITPWAFSSHGGLPSPLRCFPPQNPASHSALPRQQQGASQRLCGPTAGAAPPATETGQQERRHWPCPSHRAAQTPPAPRCGDGLSWHAGGWERGACEQAADRPGGACCCGEGKYEGR